MVHVQQNPDFSNLVVFEVPDDLNQTYNFPSAVKHCNFTPNFSNPLII